MEKTVRFNFDFTGKSVLVAEDTMISFRLFSAVLSQVNATVYHAPNGRKAIEMCSGDLHFDLVVMDLQMPEVNGLEATRAIKKMRPFLPIIAATANTFDDEEAECLAAGCAAYITKPLEFNKLFELMQSLFEGKN
ncbi:MAG: response regulator [Bacteroidetes bacterium]|nr:response regulator [Bacteroidota bacterium]